MRLDSKYMLIGLATLALSVPAWAHTYKETWTANNPVTIGTTQMKAGSYELKGDDSKNELTILQGNKVLATVPGQWVKLPKKAEFESVATDAGKITQVQFGGSDQAFQPQQ